MKYWELMNNIGMMQATMNHTAPQNENFTLSTLLIICRCTYLSLRLFGTQSAKPKWCCTGRKSFQLKSGPTGASPSRRQQTGRCPPNKHTSEEASVPSWICLYSLWRSSLGLYSLSLKTSVCVRVYAGNWLPAGYVTQYNAAFSLFDGALLSCAVYFIWAGTVGTVGACTWGQGIGVVGRCPSYA